MMKRNFLFMLVLLFATSAMASEGISFFKGTWQEALDKAKEEEKLIFVDAFTVWCGPCKRMANNVFPQPQVGDFFNENFVNVKLDMEKGEGKSFRSQYQVAAFPTLLFIDGSGELKLRHTGALNVEQLIRLGNSALTKVDYSKDYAEKYEAGDRSPELLSNYAYALKKSRKPFVKVANEYLRTQDNLRTEKNLKFIFEMTQSADSRIFDLMIENRSAIEKLTSKEQVNEKILNACRNTVQTAIEFQTDFLLDEANSKMKANYSAFAGEFELESKVTFYLGIESADEFVAAAEKYLKKTQKDKNKERNRLAQESIKVFEQETAVMAAAEKWAKKASTEQNSDYLYTYAQVLYINGDLAQAKSVAQKAVELAAASGKSTRAMKILIAEIDRRT